MRIVSTLLLTIVLLTGCNRSAQNNDAVKQGVLEHLKGRQFSMDTMTVDVTAVQFNGAKADATVTITPKGGSAAQGMSIKYQLEQQSGKWVVVNRENPGGAPHAGAEVAPADSMPPAGMAPGAQNPHGGMQMPAPENLPPASPKK